MSEVEASAAGPRPVLPRAAAVAHGSAATPREPWSWSARFAAQCGRIATPWRSRHALDRATAVMRRVAAIDVLADADIDALTRSCGRRLRREGLAGDALVEGLALAAVIADRVLGMPPYRGQLAAAASLASGHVVEMDTGEGKTLAAFLAAAIFGLARRRVHVVTVNDYLAERDAAALAPAFRRLGISSGVVSSGLEAAKRRLAYAADICFLSGKEAAFDYLRDGLTRSTSPGGRKPGAAARLLGAGSGSAARAPLQQELDIAIVDEIDSVLIDEAGTPLVISAEDTDGVEPQAAMEALHLAGRLRPGRDFLVGRNGGWPELTAEGAEVLERWAADKAAPWSIRLRREELARAALAARECLQRDRDYLVRDDKVVIVDPHTGRVMPDRQWGHDVHALVEVKEGLDPSRRRRSIASISFQRFFRNYRLVAGMSGTVREVAAELAAVYGLPLVCVPRRLPQRRHWSGRRVFRDRGQLWTALGAEVAIRHEKGQPVMVAVRSVEESRRAAAELARRAIPFRLLSAAQDQEEADIVVRAGQLGSVTVVTNMAGRGTDIRLGPGVAERGGLAILICERHHSRRVDRQLMGRAGRQGDPGEVAEFVSMQDEMLTGLPHWRRLLLRTGLARGPVTAWAFRHVQAATDRLETRRRLALLRRDEHLSRALAFAGGLD